MGYVGRGSSNQVLTENSGINLPSFKLSQFLFSSSIQTFTSSGTYTPTSGMAYCIVECLGGGGAGGGASSTDASTDSCGSGGGAGEYAVGVFSSTDIGASKSVTIGAGGVGASGAIGGNGGSTSLDSLISANGGTGGDTQANNDPAITLNFPGGLGGTGGTGGSYRTPGGSGLNAWAIDSPEFVIGGQGSDSQLGAGGISISVTGNGSAALGYGAGGGGAVNKVSNVSSRAGGNGTAGIIVITEFIL